MRLPVTACEKIARKNVDRLPRELVRGHDGNPRREAIAEVFWNAAYEIIRRVIWDEAGKHALPETIRIGRVRTFIPFDAAAWAEFQRELGLSREELSDEQVHQREQALRAILTRQFIAPNQQSSHVDLDDGPLLLRGLLVVLCFLCELSRKGSPQSYRYEVNSLTRFAGERLDWTSLALIDEGQLVRDFFPRAGLAMDRTDNLWRVPYLTCCRRLWKRFANDPVIETGTVAAPLAPPKSSPGEIPPDFLSGFLTETQVGQGSGAGEMNHGCDDNESSKAAIVPDNERPSEAIRLEIRRLREENDCLRALREFELLESILRPLLASMEDPTGFDRLAWAADLPEDVCNKVVDLLRSATLELFGQIGEQVAIRLPSLDYELLEGAPVTSDFRGLEFEIVRRGVRVFDRTMIPAVVEPAKARREAEEITESVTDKSATRRYCLGIDLGTTNTVAAVWEHGSSGPRPISITQPKGGYTPNDFGREELLPSAVLLASADHVFVGRAVKQIARLRGDRVVTSIKRFMGRRWRPSADELDRDWTPELISACILRAIHEEVVKYYGELPSG